MDSTPQTAPHPKIKDLPKKQRGIIRAWCMYDWANSAFATSGVAAIFPVYFVLMFKDALGEDAVFFGITFTGSSMWTLGVALSTSIVALSSPVLGVIADRVAIKKTLLWIYTIAGSVFTILAFFSAYTAQPWAWMFGMFTLANVGFAGGLVFYNAILPHLAPREMLDDVSSRGFALGYAGGGLLLLIHLVLILATQDTDLADLVTRISIASIGLWWFGWAIWTLKVVPEPPILNPVHGMTVGSAISLGFRELGKTFRELTRFRVVLVFLGAYLLFNDGLQTVLAIAGAFAADTIGIPLAFNMMTILIVQFVASGGAMAFGWLAGRTTTKAALTVSLLGWILVVMFGVAVAPLPPSEHGDFDFQLDYDRGSGAYVMSVAPDLPDSGFELRGRGGEIWVLSEGIILTRRAVLYLPDAIRDSEDVKYSLSISGGDFDGESAVGPAHPSVLGGGPIDWWPDLVAQTDMEAAGTRRRLPVADARSVSRTGHRRQPGARQKPLRTHHPIDPERGVLLVLRVHEPGVLGVRAASVYRRYVGVRYARGGHVDPADHSGGHDRTSMGERRRRRESRGGGRRPEPMSSYKDSRITCLLIPARPTSPKPIASNVPTNPMNR